MKAAIFTKIFDDRPLEAAIETAAEIGFDGVEIMARDPHLSPDTTREQGERLRELADEHGVEIPCLATYTGGYARASDDERAAELETFERYLELSEPLGVELLRHGAGGPTPREATDEEIETAAAWLGRAADRAAAYDRTIGLEIHPNRLTETVDSTLQLLELVDRDNVGVIHDAGNMFIVSDTYGPESVERLGEDLLHAHIKDLSRSTDPELADTFWLETPDGDASFRHELLGDGGVDHEPLIGALAESGYSGYATLESNVTRIDPETVAAEELDRLSERFERAT